MYAKISHVDSLVIEKHFVKKNIKVFSISLNFLYYPLAKQNLIFQNSNTSLIASKESIVIKSALMMFRKMGEL